MNKETDMTMKLNPYFKDTLETSNVVWSHDENSYQFNFDFTDYLCKNPVELMNSHPRILLEFLNDECSDKQIYPLIIDSERLGQAHFIIPDKILGYVGDVKASLTIDFDNKSHDLGSFYFRMKKSPIDDKMPELQFWVDEFDQAFELFKHGLDEFNEDIKESNAKVDEIKDLIVKNDVLKKVEAGPFGDFRDWDDTLIAKMKNEFSERGLNPKWFGAKGDGITDDTEAVQKCIDFASSIGMKTKISGATFLIKAHVNTPTNTTHYLMNEGGIRVPDNAIIEFSRDGILKPIPHNKKASNVLRTYNNKNIKIINPNIEDNYNGDKEWNYGIAIQGGENIEIVNPEIHGFSGDGINIQRSSLANEEMYIPKNIRILGGNLRKNGRQSISIEEVDGILVDGTLVGRSDKNLPMSAIDIEPAWVQPQDKTVCRNIHLKNLEFSDNQYNGFQIIGSHHVKDVLLENCIFARNNLSGKNTITNKIGSCENVIFKNCVFEKGEKIQFSGVKNIELSNPTFCDAFLDVEQTSNNLNINSALFTYTNLKAGIQPINVRKGAASVCEITIKDSIIDLDDDGIRGAEHGILPLISLRGMTSFTSINNVYRNAGRAIDNAFYNNDALALQFTSIGDTFENIRQQAIITTAHEVRIIKPTFLGVGYETATYNGFSRDIQWNMQPNAKKLILSHAYGDKQPTNSNIVFKDIGFDNNTMLYVTGSVSTARISGGNNICDYSVQSKYTTGSTVNSVSSTAGTLTTIHKPLDDYSRFSPNTIILILSTGQIGYINEGYKFFEFLRKE